MTQLTVEPRGGLANRMRAVASATVVAEWLRMPLKIAWTPHATECNCAMEDLFEGMVSSGSPPRGRAGVHSFGEVAGGQTIRLGGAGDATEVHLSVLTYLYPEGMAIDTYADAVATAVRRMEPTRAVLEQVGDVPVGTWGLQIRRTDHWHATRYAPLSLFIARAKRALDTEASHLLLCTDSPEVRRQLQLTFGSRLLEHEAAHLGRDRREGVQSALAEIARLSRTKRILAAGLSTFGQLAAIRGGVPMEELLLASTPRRWTARWSDRLQTRHMRWHTPSGRWRAIAMGKGKWLNPGHLLARMMTTYVTSSWYQHRPRRVPVCVAITPREVIIRLADFFTHVVGVAKKSQG